MVTILQLDVKNAETGHKTMTSAVKEIVQTAAKHQEQELIHIKLIVLVMVMLMKTDLHILLYTGGEEQFNSFFATYKLRCKEDGFRAQYCRQNFQ